MVCLATDIPAFKFILLWFAPLLLTGVALYTKNAIFAILAAVLSWIFAGVVLLAGAIDVPSYGATGCYSIAATTFGMGFVVLMPAIIAVVILLTGRFNWSS